jgi:hypothetical protein
MRLGRDGDGSGDMVAIASSVIARVNLLAAGKGSATILAGQLTSKTPIKTATKHPMKTGGQFLGQ